MGVIYKGSQSSPHELAFGVELGGFISYGIKAKPLLVGGAMYKGSLPLVWVNDGVGARTCNLKGSGMMCPTSVREGGLGCFIYGFTILPSRASFWGGVRWVHIIWYQSQTSAGRWAHVQRFPATRVG